MFPSIRNEQVREDLVRTFAAARNRALKHTSNNVDGVNTIHLPLVVSTPASILKSQLETRLDGV